MSGPFDGKRVLLGVSGSIAAYKAIDIASKLTQAGAIVNVLMSPAATQFVTPLTFRSITHQDVVTDLFDIHSRQAIEHVALAKEADVLVVAPGQPPNFFPELSNWLRAGSSHDPLKTRLPIRADTVARVSGHRIHDYSTWL